MNKAEPGILEVIVHSNLIKLVFLFHDLHPPETLGQIKFSAPQHDIRVSVSAKETTNSISKKTEELVRKTVSKKSKAAPKKKKR